MGNPNVHNHKRCPLFFAGHAGGRIEGQPAHQGRRRHADGRRDARGPARASAWTLDAFGDSTSPIDLNGAKTT